MSSQYYSNLLENLKMLLIFFFVRPKVDENADPNDSLMTMMKQMYDEGDDEMKRTITN
jgi:hypothetical protein